jgi:hypothetical protein
MAKVQLKRKTTKHYCGKPVDKCVENPVNNHQLSHTISQPGGYPQVYSDEKRKISTDFCRKKI